MNIKKDAPASLFKYNNQIYNEKIYRLYNWMNGQQAPPYKFIIVPTNRCNLKCFCCPNAYARSVGRFKEEDELTNEQWLEIVNNGLRMGVKEWYILGGGEPFMRKKLVLEIIQRIKEKDFFNICEVITNGTLWNRNDIKKIVNLKLDRLLISIDSCDNLHDYLRRTPGAFKKASATLKLFKKYKKKLKSDKPIIQMNSVLNNRNYPKIKEITQFAIDNSVDELAFHPMREYEETRELMKHLKLTKYQEKEMYKNMLEANELAENSGMKFNMNMIKESKDYCKTRENEKPNKNENNIKKKANYMKTRCFEPFYSMFIDPKGNVNYCCAAGDGKDENNIIKKGLNQMWYGDFFTNIRSIIIKNDKTENCDSCGLLDMTKGLRDDLRKYSEFIENE